MPETRILTRSVIENYLNVKSQLTTEFGENPIYTCPSTVKASIVILCHVANTDPNGDDDCALTIGWKDHDDDDVMTYLLHDANLPARSGLNVLAGKLFLEPLDSVWAKVTWPVNDVSESRAHLTMSILEIS